MIFNISGGGGTALNFRVVGGTTAPSNPKENAIWVNTDTEITSWIFSATEPSPAEAGMVWISTGTESTTTFNALKKNAIQVCPISAKQYIDGAWVEKAANIYQNGEWVTWIWYLYKAGNEYTALTGGWIGSTTPAKDVVSGSRVAYAPAISRNATELVGTVPKHSTYVYTGAIRTSGKVDVTAFSTLHMDVTLTAGSGDATGEQFFLYADPVGMTTFVESSCASTYYSWTHGAATKTLNLTCDISAMTGPCYIGLLYRFNHDVVLTARITKVWLD